GQLEPLTLGEEHEGVLADRVAATRGCDADLAGLAGLAGGAVGAKDPLEVAASGLGDGLGDPQGGARGGVALVTVVDLEQLGVPVLAERAGDEAGDLGEQGDADAE